MADVLFIAPDLHRGGVGRCVSFIVDAAPALGVTCALFLLRGRDRQYTVENPDVTFGLPQTESNLRMALGMPAALWRLYRTIRRTQPRIVCSHGLMCNFLVMVLRTLTRGTYRTVAFEHNAPRSHYAQARLGRLKTAMLTWCYPRHDRVVGVSRGVANDLKAMLPGLRDRCVPIYNGIDLQAVHEQSKSPAEKPGVLDEPALRIVALGRLTDVKGFDILIEAARLLDDPSIGVDIVGEGPDEPALQKQIAQSPSRTTVRLMGHRDNPFPLIAAGTVFVMTSRRESFGNVLIEALTLGLPIIATNCPYGPAEILNQGQYGVLVPVDDAPALAQAIRAMLEDAPTRAHYAVQGPARADEFSLEEHCRQVVQLFQPLLRSI